jgi:hypothetical protein
MANEFNTNKNALTKQNRYYKEVSEAYQKVLNEDYKGNIYLAEGGKMASRFIVTVGHKGTQLANGLKHEVTSLLKEFDCKAATLPGGSRQEMLKLDQCREHYTVVMS